MTFVRSLSKFMLELFPLVLATVISAVLVSTLHLTAGTTDAAQARRSAPDAAAEPIVYVTAMPHIDRGPAPTVVAALPPANADVVAPTETPATAATPVAAVQPTAADAVTPLKSTPRPQTATAPASRERAARSTIATRTAVASKPEPAAKVDPAAAAKTDLAKTDLAKTEGAVASVQAAPAFAPPMPIPPMAISAEAQNAGEPTRVFGMTVPSGVVTVGGEVIGAAKFPLEVAEVAVPSPLARVGFRIVEKVAGAAGAAIFDSGR